MVIYKTIENNLFIMQVKYLYYIYPQKLKGIWAEHSAEIN